MSERPVFHEGELEAQRRAGEEEIAAHTSKVIRPFLVAGAIPFLRQLPMFIAGSEDLAGHVWASIVYGTAGFLDPSEDGRRVKVHLEQSLTDAEDPIWTNIAERPEIGLLFLEPITRRRVRVNGSVGRVGNTLTVDVGESYAICPKYIQKREIQVQTRDRESSELTARRGQALEVRQVAQVLRADTFFVASSHLTHGPDVSHRGGKPGFVTVLDDGDLWIPDYRGNSMLSSFGNFTLNPRAGLVFADYENGTTLQLIGNATLSWDQPDPENKTGGTKRFWRFRLDSWRESRMPAAVRERFLEYSPFNP